MVILLGFVSYRNLSGLRDIGEISAFPPMPEMELPPLDLLTPGDIEDLLREYEMNEMREPETVEYLRHSLNNAVTFEYPSHWSVSDTDIAGEYRDLIEPLFVAQSPSATRPTIFVASKLNAENIEEGIETMEEVFRRERTTMNITERSEDERGVYLEINYDHEDGQTAKSKEKIIRVNNDLYLFSVIAYTSRFEDHSELMGQVIESIQVIDQM